MGRQRPDLRFFRHLATGHQHRHDDRHLPDGLPDPEHPEPRHGAIHLKLDELIRVNKTARNSLLNLEEMSEEEVAEVKQTFDRLVSRQEAAQRELQERPEPQPSAARAK